MAHFHAGQVVERRQHLRKHQEAQLVIGQLHVPVLGLGNRPQAPQAQRHDDLRPGGIPLAMAEKLDNMLVLELLEGLDLAVRKGARMFGIPVRFQLDGFDGKGVAS